MKIVAIVYIVGSAPEIDPGTGEALTADTRALTWRSTAHIAPATGIPQGGIAEGSNGVLSFIAFDQCETTEFPTDIGSGRGTARAPADYGAWLAGMDWMQSYDGRQCPPCWVFYRAAIGRQCDTHGFQSLSACAMKHASEVELRDFERTCAEARQDLNALDAEDARDRAESEHYRETQNDARRQAILERLYAARQSVENAGESLADY